MGNWTWKLMTFRIAGAGTSVLSDISAFVNQQSLQSAITDLDTTGMGATARTRVNGLPNVSIQVNGFTNSTTEAILGPIVSGTSVAKRIEFKEFTNKYYTGSAMPTSIQFSGAPDTLLTWSATLVVTGALTRTSVALT